MKGGYIEILQKFSGRIDSPDPKHFIAKLSLARVITGEDYDQINSKVVKSERYKCLIEILGSGPDSAYDDLVKTFEKNGYAPAVKFLQQEKALCDKKAQQQSAQLSKEINPGSGERGSNCRPADQLKKLSLNSVTSSHKAPSSERDSGYETSSLSEDQTKFVKEVGEEYAGRISLGSASDDESLFVPPGSFKETPGTPLGQGWFAEVKKCTYDGNEVAAKFLFRSETREAVLKEIKTIK